MFENSKNEPTDDESITLSGVKTISEVKINSIHDLFNSIESACGSAGNNKIKEKRINDIMKHKGNDSVNLLLEGLQLQYNFDKKVLGIFKECFDLVGTNYFDDIVTQLDDLNFDDGDRVFYTNSEYLKTIRNPLAINNFSNLDGLYDSNLNALHGIISEIYNSKFNPSEVLNHLSRLNKVTLLVKKHFSLFVEMWFIDEFPKSAFEKIMNNDEYCEKIKKKFKYRYMKQDKKQQFMQEVNKKFLANFYKTDLKIYSQISGWIAENQYIHTQSNQIINQYVDFIDIEFSKIMNELVALSKPRSIEKQIIAPNSTQVIETFVENPILIEEPKTAERKSIPLPENIQSIVDKREAILKQKSPKVFMELLKKLKKTFNAERFIESNDIKNILRALPAYEKLYGDLILETQCIWNTYYQTTDQKLLKKFLD